MAEDDVFESFFPQDSLHPDGSLGESCEDIIREIIQGTIATPISICSTCTLRRNKKTKRSCSEIERKFLVEKIPDIHSLCGVHVWQGYLIAEDKAEVRIRKEGLEIFTYTLAIKSGGTLVRKEYEIALSEKQFNTLWPFTEGRLKKDRYCIPYEMHILELSVYKKDLEGLVIVEVEFDSIEQARAFKPPDWLGADVTEDARYKNKNLRKERGDP